MSKPRHRALRPWEEQAILFAKHLGRAPVAIEPDRVAAMTGRRATRIMFKKWLGPFMYRVLHISSGRTPRWFQPGMRVGVLTCLDVYGDVAICRCRCGVYFITQARNIARRRLRSCGCRSRGKCREKYLWRIALNAFPPPPDPLLHDPVIHEALHLLEKHSAAKSADSRT